MILHVPVQVIGHLVALDVGRLGGVTNKMAATHVLKHLRVNAGGHSGYKDIREYKDMCLRYTNSSPLDSSPNSSGISLDYTIRTCMLCNIDPKIAKGGIIPVCLYV